MTTLREWTKDNGKKPIILKTNRSPLFQKALDIISSALCIIIK